MSYRNVTPNTATSSQDRLTEIRDRLDAATPGPWEYVSDPVGALCGPDGRNIIEPYAGYGDESDWPDVTLIAHAPADIAWLLAEVEAWKQHCLACDCQRHCGVELTDCDCTKCNRYKEQRA